MALVQIFTTIVYDIQILRKCNFLHIAKFSTNFYTFDTLLVSASQQSLNCKNRTTFAIFAILLSFRNKSKSGPIFAIQALLYR